MAKQISIPKIEVPMDTYFLAESEVYQETQACDDVQVSLSKCERHPNKGIWITILF